MAKNGIKTAVVHGFIGRGPSVPEAKAHAIQKIESLQEGGWTPRLIHHKGMVGVVFRDLNGWSYFIIRPGEMREHPCTCMLCESDYKNVANACKRHMAQNGWEYVDGCSLPEILCDSPVQDRTEFINWTRWQTAAYEAKQRGLNDEECRAYANSVA